MVSTSHFWNHALSILFLWLLWLYTLFFLGVLRPAFELEREMEKGLVR